MTIITVTGYKGGIGKSTTAFYLAAYFSDLGKTALIDGDSNRTAIKGRAEQTLGNSHRILAKRNLDKSFGKI